MGNVVTKVTYEGNGTINTFAVPCAYLSRTHIHVYINNVEITEGFTWATAYTLQFATPPASGEILTIERSTPIDESFISWKDGTIIVAGDLNAQGLQSLFIDQERQTIINVLQNFLTSTAEKTAFEENLADFSTLLKYSPVSFGQFRVSTDGDLILEYFGNLINDDCSINTDGELIITIED